MNGLTKKQILLSLLGIAVVVAGVVVGSLFIGDSQDNRNQASVPSGTVEVSLNPTTLTLEPGQTKTAKVMFNTKGVEITTINVLVRYTYTGSTMPIAVDSAIVINPVILTSNGFCSTKQVTPGVGNVTISVSCSLLSGYTNTVSTELFSFSLTPTSGVTGQTLTFGFDNAATTVTSMDTSQDVAAIPVSQMVVTIPGAAATPSPTPSPTASTTTRSPTPTPSSSTTSPTPTPSTSTATPRPGSCNTSCSTSADCISGFSCTSGVCRDNRCKTDSSCKCETVNVASKSGTTALPQSGFDQTTALFALGMIFLLAGGQLLYTFSQAPEEE